MWRVIKALQIAGFAVVLAGGCILPFRAEVKEKVDREVTFDKLIGAPNDYIGRTVMVGGSIIETKPLESGGTEIIVLEQPLSFDYSPAPGDRTRGRFLLLSQDFLDPAVYSKGRKITVVAVVKGVETRLIGEKNYDYPILEALEIKLWPPPFEGPGILFFGPMSPYDYPYPPLPYRHWTPIQRGPR